MSNESTNHSEENVTYDDKRNRLIDIIKKDQNNNYGSYAALIGIVLTISGIIVKGISTVVIAGYNNYFSINSSYNHISETNVFSNLFDILFGSIILLVLNFFDGICNNKSKKFVEIDTKYNFYFCFVFDIIVYICLYNA